LGYDDVKDVVAVGVKDVFAGSVLILLPPTPNGNDDLIQLSEGILGSGNISFSVRRLFNPAFTLFDL
jgi:hypothetical protein